MPLRFTRVADQQAREATNISTAPQITAEIPVHDVETSIRRGAAWAVSSQIASQAIRIVGVVVLARLLSKQDYGSAGLAVIVASYSVMLGDLGYGTALVQRPKIRSARPQPPSGRRSRPVGFASSLLRWLHILPLVSSARPRSPGS